LQLDKSGTAPGFRRDPFVGAYGGPMLLISARSAWYWAAKLAAQYGEPFDLVLREILAAVDRRDVSARNPDDLAETWRILLPVMIEHIDRDRRGHIDPEPVLGPGILGIARSIIIDTADLERWLSARGLEQRDAPASVKPSNGRRSDHAVDPQATEAVNSQDPAAKDDFDLRSSVTPSRLENRQKPRRGPEPGTVDRFGDSDRALFSELEALMAGEMSRSAAALQLADQGKVAGTGTPESRAKRLADRYRRERGSGANRIGQKLAPTR
jgi:hypothetical protein